MRTKLTTIEELKEAFVEMLINHTDKITKVSPLSGLNAVAYGVAKIGQKTLKEVALVETSLFPEFAVGKQLDDIAARTSLSPRFGESGSSVYVRLVGVPGTFYDKDLLTVKGSDGIDFSFESNVVIGQEGFVYTKLRSNTLGQNTNVEALSLTRISPVPNGHQYLVNEYNATGGRDLEDDDSLRNRIFEGPNIMARTTLSMITQVFLKINSNVLRVLYNGVSSTGKTQLTVLSQNGIDFNEEELDELQRKSQQFLSLNELKPFGLNSTFNLQLLNPVWQPIDISVRLDVNLDMVEDVRREIQIRINKHFDYRYWEKDKIEWDDLLVIFKTTPGVRYVLDNHFYPRFDLMVEKGKIPRVRGFRLLNLKGELISDPGNNLNPIYYPIEADFNYQTSVYKHI